MIYAAGCIAGAVHRENKLVAGRVAKPSQRRAGTKLTDQDHGRAVNYVTTLHEVAVAGDQYFRRRFSFG